ncbi:L,D-transpeptidase family protein [Salinisphaera orenii]|uniref:L,D-TPase catalytic domain-containing protein n=1 Tax=Salinisphaera orenii YIM 95161 TaxID=1051139 RepID=A0A423PJD9_9GAMM|nr:L,D-transpeptidase family protein [Salinisphaera halophila]ROO25707.1 hypothetical protein SAHL_13720 [Salinisphaera halophila YIM 95161]
MTPAAPRLIALALGLLGGTLGAPSATADSEPPATSRPPLHSEAETRLMTVIALARQGDYNRAIDDLSDLIDERPNFRLAQLVYGELMVARAGRSIDPLIGEDVAKRRDALLAEAESRWNHRSNTATDGRVPNAIVQLAPEHEHAIVADLDHNRVYLFANDDGAPRLMADFYATIGSSGAGKEAEGDMRTPVGVYHVTRYLNDNQLPELYGIGALPVNYPNALDRTRGRTGHGIWLHGVPRATYARSPQASEGCVVIANDDFERLRERVDVGATPVIMTQGVDWVSPAEAETIRTEVRAAIEDWRHSWEAIDTSAHLAYYDADFVSDEGRDKAAYAAYKKKVNARKEKISVDIDQLSIFRYPGEQEMVKVTFDQAYRSNNYRSKDRKTQYWQRNDDGRWRIVLDTEAD